MQMNNIYEINFFLLKKTTQRNLNKSYFYQIID
jgi:hypothetical protein